MTDIDEKLLQTLKQASNNGVPSDDAELSIFGLIGESFRSRMRWVVFIAILLILVFAGLTIYCAIEMFHAVDAGQKIEWAAMGLASFIVFAMLRLWYFMELNRLSITREIKRVELQLSLLARQL